MRLIPADNRQEQRTVASIKTDQARKGQLTVTSSPTKLFAKNPNRILISMVNASSQTVYIGFDKSVTTATGGNPGYELLPNGIWDDDHYIGEYWAVVSGPKTSNISFIEMGLQQ